MPIYELRNKETDEVFEISMKISEYEEYLKENPHMERYYSKIPTFMDSVVLGIKKPPIEFKECVIDRIKRNNPLHKMESRWD